MQEEIATLAGGCFWCLEAVFERLAGVNRVVSGYMGGAVEAPSYKEVCSGRTGHAEVVQVHFDPAVITFTDLLEVFFSIHDPTTLNRQGNDVGTQYRSAVFYHSADQKSAARAFIRQLGEHGEFNAPVVTELVPAGTFWAAEGYHQGYFEANPLQPYCMAVVAPKVRKAIQKFGDRLK